MLLGLNTEPLLKPSVGKWELGTIGERIRSQVKNAVAPRQQRIIQLSDEGGRGHTWGGHHTVIRHNAGPSLVTETQHWPLIGHEPPPPPPHRPHASC